MSASLTYPFATLEGIYNEGQPTDWKAHQKQHDEHCPATSGQFLDNRRLLFAATLHATAATPWAVVIVIVIVIVTSGLLPLSDRLFVALVVEVKIWHGYSCGVRHARRNIAWMLHQTKALLRRKLPVPVLLSKQIPYGLPRLTVETWDGHIR